MKCWQKLVPWSAPRIETPGLNHKLSQGGLITAVTNSTHVQRPLLNLDACSKPNGNLDWDVSNMFPWISYTAGLKRILDLERHQRAANQKESRMKIRLEKIKKHYVANFWTFSGLNGQNLTLNFRFLGWYQLINGALYQITCALSPPPPVVEQYWDGVSSAWFSPLAAYF